MIVLKTGGTGRKGCGVGRKGKMEDKRKSSIKRGLLVKGQFWQSHGRKLRRFAPERKPLYLSGYSSFYQAKWVLWIPSPNCVF